jgi:hypothetical protein
LGRQVIYGFGEIHTTTIAHTIANRLLLGFVIGISSRRINHLVHGALLGFLFSLSVSIGYLPDGLIDFAAYNLAGTFYGALVMEQFEAGTIRLDDPMDTWIAHPEGDQITVEMLLRHTSGLPNYTDMASRSMLTSFRAHKLWQPQELIEVVMDQPLKFEPGSRYKYSNTN